MARGSLSNERVARRNRPLDPGTSFAVRLSIHTFNTTLHRLSFRAVAAIDRSQFLRPWASR